MEDDLYQSVDNILEQLSRPAHNYQQPEPELNLTQDQLEDFIINNSGKLVLKTLSVIDNVKDYISSAPDAKDVASFAELLKAASTNLEALNKVYISRERNKTQKEIKQMDIDTRKEINTQDNATFLLSRKELMQELINHSKDKSSTIDI
jgi:hypothetical protein